MINHLVKRNRQSSFITCHYIAGAVAHKYYINVCIVNNFCERKIVSSKHGNFFSMLFHTLQCVGSDFFYFFVRRHLNKIL